MALQVLGYDADVSLRPAGIPYHCNVVRLLLEDGSAFILR